MKARNGILRGEYKVKDGKLIKCIISIKNGKIENIKISGDFFMYPEEKIEKLEEKLKGIEYKEENIKKALNEFFKEVEVIGADKQHFLKLIMEAKPTYRI